MHHDTDEDYPQSLSMTRDDIDRPSKCIFGREIHVQYKQTLLQLFGLDKFSSHQTIETFY